MNTIEKNQVVSQVYTLLKYAFTIVPIAAGADKFLNLLTDWSQYINPSIEGMLPVSGSSFMMIAGVVEILAGVLVFVKPKIGGLVVAAWLTLIALQLLVGFNYVDVAVRDLVMAAAAFSMAKLASVSDK